MKFQYNDGGRAAAGYQGVTSDCVTRAIAIVTGIAYSEVYDMLNKLAGSERIGKRKKKISNARTGVFRSTYEKYLKLMGYVWVPTMQIGQGCKVHLIDGELPMGRLIVRVSKHLTAVVDGVIHDTHDPSDRGSTVYSNDTPVEMLPKGAYLMENGNGWCYAPGRCVYGYYYHPEDVIIRHKKDQLAQYDLEDLDREVFSNCENRDTLLNLMRIAFEAGRRGATQNDVTGQHSFEAWVAFVKRTLDK